jgi:hypothetical protein
MTRARARAIQSEVTSLLLESSLHTNEIWSLPQAETLCVIRYTDQPEEGGETANVKAGAKFLLSPELPATARNFRTPKLPAVPELPAPDDQGRARACKVSVNPGTSPEPRPELPAPGTSGQPGTSGPRHPAQLRPCQLSVNPGPFPEPPRNFRPPEPPAPPGTSGPACVH